MAKAIGLIVCGIAAPVLFISMHVRMGIHVPFGMHMGIGSIGAGVGGGTVMLIRTIGMRRRLRGEVDWLRLRQGK
jgi:hypothetical protein